MARAYLKSLRGDSDCATRNIRVSSDQMSMANYNFEHWHTLEVAPGLSCCAVPAAGDDLGKTWDRHRLSLVTLLSSSASQGLHIEVDGIGENEPFTVEVSEEGVEVEVLRFRNFWRLELEGTYTVTVKVEGRLPRTKVVEVVPGAFTDVVFFVEPSQSSMPR